MISTMYNGFLYEFEIAFAGGDGNDIVLTTFTGVPEPSSGLLLLAGMGIAALGRRRKQAV